MMDAPTRYAMAQYLRSIAEWRRSRYQDDLRDVRNLRSASSLDDLADYVLMLSPEDPRILRLGEMAMDGELFYPGQQASYEIGRFHFHSNESTLDGFLDHLVELAEQDRREHGRFGGRQAPGDDPW